MPTNIEIFLMPFMQRAFLGGLLVALLTAFLGVLVVLRRASFFGDALSHASLAGVAFGLLLGVNPILTAVVLAVLIAVGLPFLQEKTRLPLDSLLGFILPFSLAIGVIILSLVPGYQPDLISYLFGSILAIGWIELAIMAVLGILVAIIFLLYRRKLIFASFDSSYARISGLNVRFLNVLYSIILALVIVTSIRLVGIILVNALLVIPAATSRLLTKSLSQMFWLTPVLSVFCVAAGLIISAIFNLPTGPAIVVLAGVIFLVSAVVKKI